MSQGNGKINIEKIKGFNEARKKIKVLESEIKKLGDEIKEYEE